MLKLAKNILVDKNIIRSNEKDISWEYIEHFIEIINEVGFTFAYKLSFVHIFTGNECEVQCSSFKQWCFGAIDRQSWPLSPILFNIILTMPLRTGRNYYLSV